MRPTALILLAALQAGAAFAQGQVDEYQPLPPPPLPSAETSPPTPPPPPTPSSAQAAPSGPAATPTPTQAPPLTAAPPPSSTTASTTATVPPNGPPPPPRRLSRITTGPLTTLAAGMAGVSLEYEHAMSERYSLFVGPRVGVWPTLNASVSLGARYFPMTADAAPAGFWLGPESWTAFKAESGAGYSNVDFGEILLAMVGYTVIYPSGWTMSFGGGLGGGISFKSGNTQTTIVDPNGVTRFAVVAVQPFSVVPSIGLQWNVGYAF